jgi:hypothetical protein
MPVNRLGYLDVFRRAMKDKNWFAAPEQFDDLPSAIGVRSTSTGAPAAIVDASGFICAINGTNVAAKPMVTAAPVATKRKSRRVDSVTDGDSIGYESPNGSL